MANQGVPRDGNYSPVPGTLVAPGVGYVTPQAGATTSSDSVTGQTVEVSGIATTILDTTVRLLKHTTADSGGTSTAPVTVPHDSTDAPATATVAAYTANPTINDAMTRIVRSSKLLFNLAAPTAGSESGRLLEDFGDRPAKALVLRGVNEQLAINLNGVSVAGGSVDISVEWTEE